MGSRKFHQIVSALFATSALGAGAALAGITFDLRATSVNGAALGAAQTPHLIPNAALGDVVAFDVFVVVTGTDADFSNDRFTSGIGSFKSSVPGDATNLTGNLKMDVVRTATDPDTGDPIPPFGFDNLGYSVGTVQDLDGDGDLDVGSNDNEHAEDHWAVRYRLAPNTAPAGLPDGARVGFGTFTVTGAQPGSRTLVQFIGRDFFSGWTYQQDGVVLQGPSHDSAPENSILISAPVPEPTTSMLGAGAALLALARVRRRGHGGGI